MRCPACGYSISHDLPTDVPCPECGNAERSARPFIRTRLTRFTKYLCALSSAPLTFELLWNVFGLCMHIAWGRTPMRWEVDARTWTPALQASTSFLTPLAEAAWAAVPLLMCIVWVVERRRAPRSERGEMSEAWGRRGFVLALVWLASRLLAELLRHIDPFGMQHWWW